MSKLNNISVDGTVYNINDFHVIKNNSYNNPFIITEHEPGIYIVDSSEANYLPGKLYAKYIDSEDYNVRTEYYDGFLCLTDTSIDDPYTYKNIGYIFDASAGLAYPCVTQPAPWGFSLTGASSGIGNSAVKTIGNQTIYGKKVFNTLPESSVIPTTNNQLVNKKYVDELGVKVGTSVDNNYRTNIIKSKNLFNGNSFSNRSAIGVTTTFNNSEITFNGTTSGSGDIYTTTYGFYLEAGTYTFKFSRKSGTYTANGGASAIIIKKTDAWIENYEIGGIVSKPYSFTFTLDSKTQIGIEIFANASNQTFSNLILEVQLEKGSTATTYEPYIAPSIVVDGEEIYSKQTDNNTTYTLSKSGSTITLTGSDGTTTSVTDDNTTYSVNNGTLTIKQNGTSMGTFSANQSTNKTIELANTTYSNATTSASGLMSSSDKTKLDNFLSEPQMMVLAGTSGTDDITITTNDNISKYDFFLLQIKPSQSSLRVLCSDIVHKSQFLAMNNRTLRWTTQFTSSNQGAVYYVSDTSVCFAGLTDLGGFYIQLVGIKFHN